MKASNNRYMKQTKDKQMTERVHVNSRNTDSTPLLTRLQKQYLFNQQQNHQRISRQYAARNQKENIANMVNSIPASQQYTSHNVIKIDNYQNKRFKTQQGYQPMMTKSRYMGEKDHDQNLENAAIYKSSQNIVLRRDKIKRVQQRVYQSIELPQNERPLTFGLVRKTQPMKTSLQYQEDIKMKNQILDQINTLRRSQQTLNGSKDYTATGFADIQRCVNHNNKRAKYRLMTECQGKEDQQMIYCSKCAINLLQQGFKVQEIKSNGLTRKLSTSQNQFLSQNSMISSAGAPSRIQEMRNFQQRLTEVEERINQSLHGSSLKTTQIEEIEREIWQTQCVYDQMIDHLKKMKQLELSELNEKKKKKINNLQKYQKQMVQQLDSIKQMRKEMKQYRNKFVIMKQNQFQFLISSFLNKIQSYGNQYKEGEITIQKIQDQIDHIIIDLCQFCKNIRHADESRCSQNQAQTQKYQKPEDDFICKQIKGPFRTLFAEDENQSSQKTNHISNYKNGQQQSPSFKQKTKPMQRSARYNQMIKNQYY